MAIKEAFKFYRVLVLFAGALKLCHKSYLLFFFFLQEHESTDQERRERKIKNSHPDQGKVRMLSREEWEEVQEVRPRTPFESKLARPHARIRTGEPVRLVSLHISYQTFSEMKFCNGKSFIIITF